ncbi:hypothetical protein ECG_06327 [Echinococcus granulosus]|nr:hypothetical protein ECG_06327 [Echinococcus granulosus]
MARRILLALVTVCGMTTDVGGRPREGPGKTVKREGLCNALVVIAFADQVSGPQTFVVSISSWPSTENCTSEDIACGCYIIDGLLQSLPSLQSPVSCSVRARYANVASGIVHLELYSVTVLSP